jgi:hypothetical protein
MVKKTSMAIINMVCRMRMRKHLALKQQAAADGLKWQNIGNQQKRALSNEDKEALLVLNLRKYKCSRRWLF